MLPSIVSEILVCKPNPCLNGGKCSIVTASEYSCNCTGTGHAGTNCQQLLFTHSPVPKQLMDVVSSPISVTSRPVKRSELRFYTEDEDVVFTPSNLTFSRWRNEKQFTFKSKKSGLFWVTFDGQAQDESVVRMRDRLFFFYEQQNTKTLRSLASLNKECFKLEVRTHSCDAKPFVLSSTSLWSKRSSSSSLYATDGMIFANILNTQFIVALPKIQSTQVVQDFVSHASLAMENKLGGQCKKEELSHQEMLHVVKNDLFVKDFIARFNEITPSWFTLSLHKELKNIHEENIRAFVWPSHKVKSHPVCGAAAIDETSTFLVYLHHEAITMKVHDKTVAMDSDSKFCLLVDVCKKEPHFVLPPDNFGHLESMFAFSNVQTLGWKVSLKSVAFRSGVTSDLRKCSRHGVNQVLFGSAVLKYDYKQMIKGTISGVLAYDLVQRNGKEVSEFQHFKHLIATIAINQIPRICRFYPTEFPRICRFHPTEFP